LTLTCTDASTDLTCISNAILVSGTCTSCSSNTKTCSAAAVSTSCDDGFFVSSNACVACAGGVKTCTAAAAASGSACLVGFYLATTADCLPCNLNVATCTDLSTPLTCIAGFVKIGTGCDACPSGASTCSAANVATACHDGHFLSAGDCIACGGTRSRSCGSIMVSTTCLTGFVLSNGNCSPCSTGASVCTTLVATLCEAGYFLISDACT
jgi:hypothetical protein